jgi:DNA-binding NarL/FixJ family response regulator
MLTKSGSRVLGAYSDVRALQAALAGGEQIPLVAVVDAEDPRAGRLAVAALRRTYPAVKILLLCDIASQAVVQCAIEEHVEGVVLKSDAPEELILALRHVLEGRSVMPAGWQQASLGSEIIAQMLSTREREVLDHAASGLSNKEIAERLLISTNTVKFHLRKIYSILGVHNRVQASQEMSQDCDGPLAHDMSQSRDETSDSSPRIEPPDTAG